MGLFSSFFSKAASSVSFASAYSGGASVGGYGVERFQDVVDAHASIEDMVEEFELDSPECKYMSLDGYHNPWTQAYQEALEEVMLAAMIAECDPEDLIDWDEVEDDAYDYACDLAEAWYSGDDWIPSEVMDWAWYDLSDHNG